MIGVTESGIIYGLRDLEKEVFERGQTKALNPKYFAVSRDEKYAFEFPEHTGSTNAQKKFLWPVDIVGDGVRRWRTEVVIYELDLGALSDVYGGLKRLVHDEGKTEYSSLLATTSYAWWHRWQQMVYQKMKRAGRFEGLGIPRK
jgi:hypothetical protein